MGKYFFQTHANIRNFIVFLHGTKNAYKNLFELAGGQTYNLS